METIGNIAKSRLFKMIAVFALGLGLGVVFSFGIGISDGSSPCVAELKFLRKNLSCDFYDQKGSELSSLENQLTVLIESYKKTSKATRVSVFVRDLYSTRFVGINEGDVYYMASLLKVPLVIGAYKLAEVEPKILEQKILYKGVAGVDNEAFIKPQETLIPGQYYSVADLMRRAIVYSDNAAAQVLYDYYPREFLDRIMQALSLDGYYKEKGLAENPTNARSYASIFRTLFNASYLTKEYSNDALLLLTQTTYKDGAVAKLPKSATVAHKFGERTELDSRGMVVLRQLHDCGIVYDSHANEPYTFCIMTEGKNFKDLQEVIQEVSLEIYNSVIGID